MVASGKGESVVSEWGGPAWLCSPLGRESGEHHFPFGLGLVREQAEVAAI